MTSKLSRFEVLAATEFIAHVEAQVEASWHRFADLRPPEPTYSIPFFGRIDRATLVTVGANPSSKEFAKGRGWRPNMSPQEIADRLLNYFAGNCTPYHPWFSGWFRPLGLAPEQLEEYVHLDLSPRATRSMSSCNPDTFLDMVRVDIEYFFEALSRCRSVKLLVPAGSASNRKYVLEAIAESGPSFGWRVLPRVRRNELAGCARHYCLQSPDGTAINVIAFGSSPSARNAARVEFESLVRSKVQEIKRLAFATEDDTQ